MLNNEPVSDSDFPAIVSKALKSETACAGLLFLFLSILFWGKNVLGGAALFHDSFLMLFYPNAMFYKRSICFFDFPFWNPHIYSGVPFMANLQSALFYPFTYFHIFNFPAAIVLNLFVHSFLASFFIYLLARDLNISRIGAFLTGALFGFNGYFIMHYSFPSNSNSYVWLPLILLFLRRAIQSNTFSYIFLASLAFALQVFAGHPQFVLYTVIAIVVYALFSCQFAAQKIRFFKMLAIFFAVTLLIISIQIVPFFQIASESSREFGMGYEWATAGSLKLKDIFIMLFAPLWNRYFVPKTGDPHVLTIYFGLLTVLIIIFSFFPSRMLGEVSAEGEKKEGRKIWIPFAAVALAGLLMAMGGFLPFYKTFYEHIGILRKIRFPAQSLYIACFAIALLAGIGFDKLFAKNRIKWIVVVVCIADLWLFAWRAFVTIDPLFYKTETPNVSFFKKEAGLSRIFMTPRTRLETVRSGNSRLEAWLKLKDSLYPNLVMVSGLYDADGIEPVRYNRYDKALMELYRNPSSPWMNLMGIRYVVSLWDMPQGNFKQIKSWSTILYENPNAFPKAYFASDAIGMEEKNILSYVQKNPKHDFLRQVILEEAPPLNARTESSKDIAVNVTLYNPNKVSLELNSDRAGWVVLTDAYDKGWSATVNGKFAKVMRANYFQRAVPVPPGRSVIKFSYMPQYFLATLLLFFSVLAMACVAYLLRAKSVMLLRKQ